MKYITLLLCVLICSSWSACSSNRGQYAADQIARSKAVEINLAQARVALMVIVKAIEAGNPALKDIVDQLNKAMPALQKATILNHGTETAAPAIAEVPVKDLPPPTVQPEALAEHPESDNVPPPPKGWMTEIIVGTSLALPTLLLIAKTLAPMIPGVGPALGVAGDIAYKALATKDQRKADNARQVIHDNADTLSTVLDLLPPELASKIPPDVKGAIKLLVQS